MSSRRTHLNAVPAGVDEYFFAHQPPAMFREYVMQWLTGPATLRDVAPDWVVFGREGAQMVYTPQSRGPKMSLTVGVTDPSEHDADGHDFVTHGEWLQYTQPITSPELRLTDAQLRQVGLANAMVLREMWPRFRSLVLRQMAREARRAAPR